MLSPDAPAAASATTTPRQAPSARASSSPPSQTWRSTRSARRRRPLRQECAVCWPHLNRPARSRRPMTASTPIRSGNATPRPPRASQRRTPRRRRAERVELAPDAPAAASATTTPCPIFGPVAGSSTPRPLHAARYCAERPVPTSVITRAPCRAALAHVERKIPKKIAKMQFFLFRSLALRPLPGDLHRPPPEVHFWFETSRMPGRKKKEKCQTVLMFVGR